jgi:uncharacterized membrane protein YebE (DUF533 family)
VKRYTAGVLRVCIHYCQDRLLEEVFMNSIQILDTVLQTGKDLATKTREIAERGLGVPPEGEARENMLAGLGKGLVAGSLLTILLGKRANKSLTNRALKFGSLATFASFALRAFQSWQKSNNESLTNPGQALGDLSPEQVDQRAQLLVRAMISAANAEGGIDAAERATMVHEINKMGLSPDAASAIEQDVNTPLDPTNLAKQVDSMAAASEVYLISSLVIDQASPKESQYLTDLAKALGLPPELIERLNNEP